MRYNQLAFFWPDDPDHGSLDCPNWRGSMSLAQTRSLEQVFAHPSAGPNGDICWIVPEWIRSLQRKILYYQIAQQRERNKPL